MAKKQKPKVKMPEVHMEDVSKKTLGLWGEFKAFISRGNVIDLAVGIIVGAAFTAIVTSLVDDVVMPVLGIILGGINFDDLSVKFLDATISYGKFISAVINFIAISFVIFIIVKVITSLQKKVQQQAEDTAKEELEEVTKEVELLTEIRDALVKQVSALPDVQAASAESAAAPAAATASDDSKDSAGSS